MVFGTLPGGSSQYDYRDWEDAMALGSLFGNTDALDGVERSYLVTGLVTGHSWWITFESCFSNWSTWIRYGDLNTEYCDLPGAYGGVFESNNGTDRVRWTERLGSSPSGHDYEFVIEGIDGDGLDGGSGNFMITVECY